MLPKCWLNVKKFFIKICIKKFPHFFFHRMDCLATNSVWNKNYSAMMRYDKTAHHGRSRVLFCLESFWCRFKFFSKNKLFAHWKNAWYCHYRLQTITHNYFLCWGWGGVLSSRSARGQPQLISSSMKAQCSHEPNFNQLSRETSRNLIQLRNSSAGMISWD